jgi:hypothetical protein
MAKRNTDYEVNRRVEEVANLLVIEQKRAEIIQFAANKNWQISDRQVDTYIKKAKELLKTEAQESTKNRLAERAKAKRALVTMRNKCMNIQDYARAIQAQKEINKLFALYEPQESLLSVATWQDRAIQDIKNGVIEYSELVEAFDSELATQLFRAAGVRISLSEDS